MKQTKRDNIDKTDKTEEKKQIKLKTDKNR